MTNNKRGRMVDAIEMKNNQVAALMVVGYQMYKHGRLNDATRIFEGLAVPESTHTSMRYSS